MLNYSADSTQIGYFSKKPLAGKPVNDTALWESHFPICEIHNGKLMVFESLSKYKAKIAVPVKDHLMV